MSGWPLVDNPLLDNPLVAAAERHAQLGDRMLALHHLHSRQVGLDKVPDGCAGVQSDGPVLAQPCSKHWRSQVGALGVRAGRVAAALLTIKKWTA